MRRIDILAIYFMKEQICEHKEINHSELKAYCKINGKECKSVNCPKLDGWVQEKEDKRKR